MTCSVLRAMLQTTRKAVAGGARSSLALLMICLLALVVWPAPSLEAPTVQRPASIPGERVGLPKLPSRELAQALVTFGYLAEWFPDYYVKVPPRALPTPLAQQRNAMRAALGSLHCDIMHSLPMDHESVILPHSLEGHWVALPAPPGGIDGRLFVIEAARELPQHVLVVLATEAPYETTVFWFGQNAQGYTAKLLYDSFKKWRVVNLSEEMMGTTTAVKLTESGNLMLRELVEPGSGADPCLVAHDRIFRLDLKSGKMYLAAPGWMPKCKR